MCPVPCMICVIGCRQVRLRLMWNPLPRSDGVFEAPGPDRGRWARGSPPRIEGAIDGPRRLRAWLMRVPQARGSQCPAPPRDRGPYPSVPVVSRWPRGAAGTVLAPAAEHHRDGVAGEVAGALGAVVPVSVVRGYRFTIDRQWSIGGRDLDRVPRPVLRPGSKPCPGLNPPNTALTGPTRRIGPSRPVHRAGTDPTPVTGA